ncbi:P-loop containing nucleoside triphosphate hydrolase protein, partial [Mycena filopes]
LSSALYQRRASGFGHWAVTIAPRAEQDLRQYSRRDRKTFLLIVGKMKSGPLPLDVHKLDLIISLRDLSNGDFSPRNHKQINAPDFKLVPIYAANVANKLNLVYQIDCGPVHDTKVPLKVFGVYEEANIIRRSFWTSLGYELGKRGDGYKDRCTRRQPATGASDSIFVPVKFPAQPDVRLDFADVPDLPPDDVEEVSFFRSFSIHTKLTYFEQSLLESIISDLDVAFVLEISPIELDVVEHENSCYVLGRSGTGKTTTMLYKMLLVEVSASDHPEQRKLRQMFVTKSRTLANKVGEHFGKLLGGHRPSAVSKNVTAAIKADRALVLDSENDWRSDLPRKFSDLQDADFPLFVSFDEVRLSFLVDQIPIRSLQLSTMLEGDMEASGLKIAPGRPALNEKKFKSDYWSGFSQALRKDFGSGPLDNLRSFAGVISGSEQALHGKSSCLDREAYFNLGERGHSVFTDQRERIYDLFEKYRSQKRRLGDRDAAERTHGILKFLQERRKDSQGDTKPPSAPLTKIDFLLPAQVFSFIQNPFIHTSIVLRSLCSNPNGLFWAGDTAQTINVGSSFRFNHLKAFMYRIEVRDQRRREKHPELSFQPVAPPRTFELTVNYRSHAGIVNCAHSIIELITKLWPDAIDVLERERGTVDGPPPIFFTNWDPESSEAQDFLFGNKRSRAWLLFIFLQGILVRDDAARERLQREVGEIGIIMTLYESKGLEFNDVLLYNFFEDSAVLEAQWRVVLNALRCPNDAGPTPTFHKILHANVCTELKFLYVAITRARNNIWIADSSSKGEPMRRLWASRNLVRSERLEENTLGFATSSTAVEWEVRARSMFESERFSQAKLCYERAKMPREAAVAQAYHLRELATQVPNGHREVDAKKAAFLSAANAFVTCAENDVGTAGRIYLRRAGECFEHGGDIGKAIKAHSKARHFDRVVELYRTANQFDQAIDIIEGHRQDINPKLAEEVTSKARFFYLEKGQIQKGLRLFDSPEEALEYLQKRGLKTQEASVLELLGKFSAAAELHLQDGRTLKAAELFLQDRAGNRALECLLQAVSLGLVPNDPLVSRILQLAGKVDPSTLSQSTRDEVCVISFDATVPLLKSPSLAFRHPGYSQSRGLRAAKPWTILLRQQ